MIEDETADTILLNNRVQIEIATASFRVTRGYTYAAVLCDETAFWRDETSANPDEEIFKALRPGMATIPGAILLNASSPYRKKGVLYSTYKRHYGKDGARVLVWKAASIEMNPSLDAEVIKEAYEADPAGSAAEYGGDFREDILDFVDRAAVEACVEPGCFELPRVSGVSYFGFVDMSGGGPDSAALGIAHRGSDGKGVLDLVREIKGPASPESTVIEFSATLKSYGLLRVTGDRYAGEWPRERFKEHGITYDPSELPKSAIYQNLLPLLNSGKLELLDNKTLIAQFCGLERRTARGGKDSIDHADKAHDDVANAAAGALLPMAGKADPLDIWAKLVD